MHHVQRGVGLSPKSISNRRREPPRFRRREGFVSAPVAGDEEGGVREMAVSGVFSGAVLTAIDEKGRVAIAASLRNSIPSDGKSRSVYIATHPEAPCLILSGEDRLTRIATELARDEDMALQRGVPFNRAAERRRRYGAGETVACDGSGRFVLPPLLRELSELGEETTLFLYGVGEFVEVWPLARLLALDGSEFVDAQRAARAAVRLAELRK